MQRPSPAAVRLWSEVHAWGLLAALAVAVATRAMPVLLVGVVSLGALFAMARGRHPRAMGLGAANLLTLGRLALVVVGLLVAKASLTALGVLALAAFALDGVDGWLARRFEETDELGGQLDMETDAYAVLAMSVAIVVTDAGPPWVLAAGAVRYVFVAARGLTGATPSGERRSRLGRYVFFALMSALIAGCLPIPPAVKVPVLGLGVALVLASFSTDFRLLAKETWRPRALVPLVVLFDVALFVPTLLFTDAHDEVTASSSPAARALGSVLGALHVSVEWLALVALVAFTAKTRAAGLTRWAAAGLYALFLVFLAYHQGYLFFFHRPPALVSDYRFLVHLGHFLRTEPKWAAVFAAFLGAVTLAVVLVAELFRHLQEWARGVRPLHLGIAAAAALGACGASLAHFPVARDAPVVQLLSKHAAANYKFSMLRRDMQRSLAAGPPDTRYDAFMRPMLRHKPNVHLLMVEAYGGVLGTSDMRDAWREALEELEARLARRGHSFAAAYSRSPIHSGTSWLAISTVQTGVRIDNQGTYEVLEVGSAVLPSLTAFFRTQGYHTMALLPGNTDSAGLHAYDLFGRDTVVEYPAIAYPGPRYGWGYIPDQYSLGAFRERWLRAPPSPRFVFFMSVSTHWDWMSVPPYVDDWHTLEGMTPTPANLPPRPGAARIGRDDHRRYFSSVDYDLRVLGDYIEAEGDDDAVFVILGDHQPKLQAAMGSWNTPLHVIGRDRELIERFWARGFSRSLFPDPASAATITHEGFFSLFASTLVAHGGAGATLPVYPEGIPTNGLKR